MQPQERRAYLESLAPAARKQVEEMLAVPKELRSSESALAGMSSANS
jgi:hypothetical protein